MRALFAECSWFRGVVMHCDLKRVMPIGLALLVWVSTSPVARATDPLVLSAWSQWSDSATGSLRVITQGDGCPEVTLNGVHTPMQQRVAPSVAAARGKAQVPRDFPVRVCATPIQRGDQVRVGTELFRSLPMPTDLVQRVVVIGDTGCRMKSSENAFQDCENRQAWPFAQLAASAAREHPDLIIHVGDYHYRETPCPVDQPCAGRSWGYGWSAWEADFFVPAAPLLTAAPWIFVRGNHEECARAGQGWMRFFDGPTYAVDRQCDELAKDAQANHTPPYVIDLGGHWQFIVFDSSYASHSGDSRAQAVWSSDMETVVRLASIPGKHSIFVSHHPVLGLAPGANGEAFGNQPLLDAFTRVNGAAIYPPGVDMGLHGHFHLFEAISFRTGQAPELVAGHGGDKLDRPFEVVFDQTDNVIPGVQLDQVAHADRFGYLVMERHLDGWTVVAHETDGRVAARCELQPGRRRLPCTGQVQIETHP